MTDSPAVDWNEETLRSLVLGPLLAALQIAPNSVSIERRFTIRLGRTEHRVEGESASGRADAVVRNAEGHNLFVVELKSPSEKLEDKDRDQGISYARLLDRIAPFVVLSNGRQTRIFDTISKKELSNHSFPSESAFFANGCRLSLDEDVAARFEALEHFVGYSQANVRSFSLAQVERSIQPLLGTPRVRGKYVPDVYVQRESVRVALNAFLEDDALVLALIGDSGCGKTNELCALARMMAQTHIVLFFSALSIVRTPDEALADEFNWAFSQTLNTPQIVRHLVKIAERLDQPVFIFIDALDESEAINFAAACSEFAKHLSGASKRIRLVVSAKSTEWKRFAWLKGVASHLNLGLSCSRSSDRVARAAWHSGQPVMLGSFSETELDQALGRYRSVFAVHPAGHELRTLCRDPFFLRTFCEVYEGKGESPPQTTRDELITHWLLRKFDAMQNPDASRAHLRLLAQRIYERALTVSDRDLPRFSRESVLDIDLGDANFGELIAHGMVLQVSDSHDRRALRFYYSQVLYFLIARFVLRLDQISVDAFHALLPSLLEHEVTQGVLAWYMREAQPGQQAALESELRGRALTFVTAYTLFFETWMPALRARVAPFTEGAIGIAYIAHAASYVSFGFYPQNATNAKPVTVATGPVGPQHDSFEALSKLGCVQARGGGVNFANSDPRRAAIALAWEFVMQLVKSGGLDERTAPLLAIESILAIAGHYEVRKKLGLPPASYRLPVRDKVLPLELSDLRIRAQEYLGLHRMENDWVIEQIRTRSRFTNLNESGGGSIDTTGFDRETARQTVREAVAGGRDFSNDRFVSDRELAHLIRLIDEMAEKGITRIENDLLPAPDLPVFHSAKLTDVYSETGIRPLIESFFRQGFDAYLGLVASNFGRLASKLKTFARQPIRVEVAYIHPHVRGKRNGWEMTWGYGQDLKSEGTTVHVDSSPREHYFQGKSGARGFLGPDGFAVDFVSGQGLEGLFFPHQLFGFGPDHTNRPSSVRDAPIRQFAYAWIERDLKDISADTLTDWVLDAENENKCDQDAHPKLRNS